jgi:delta 1-pyrroline-5-carboxylate dehydrogenase
MRGLEVAEFACGISHLLKGGYSENVSTGVDVFSIRQSLGVVAIISPFNFPAMVPLWFVPIAIACGNAVVIKPSEKDPSAVNAVAKLWQEAGLPEGVMNVVHGDKEAVDALLEHDDVKAVSFVGSTPIAKYVYETATANGKRVQALGGAKNHMLVLPDADLDLAADAAINAGFGSAGERCMAISALIAVEPIADELIDKIKERMAKLRTGDGTRNPDMGPLVTKVHRDKVASYLDLGVEAYLLRASLLAVMAQRLARLTCVHCKEVEHVAPHIRETLEVAPDEVFHVGRGCAHCEGLGVKKRRAVYELMVVTPAIQRLIVPGAEADLIHSTAIKEGMTPLTQAAVQLARSGAISLMEAWRLRAD